MSKKHLIDYLNGRLDRDQASTIENQIKMDDALASDLANLRRQRILLRQALIDPDPNETLDQVGSQIKNLVATTPSTPKPSWVFQRKFFVAGLGAAIVYAVLFFTTGHRLKPESSQTLAAAELTIPTTKDIHLNFRSPENGVRIFWTLKERLPPERIDP